MVLMMEAARTFETFVNFYQTTWQYDPEDSQLLFIYVFELLEEVCNGNLSLSL
jgi:hypothetical protein